MGAPAENVKLDDDVCDEPRELSERSGRSLAALANDASRELLRYESAVMPSIQRGVSELDTGRTRTTDEVRAFFAEQRLARRTGPLQTTPRCHRSRDERAPDE